MLEALIMAVLLAAGLLLWWTRGRRGAPPPAPQAARPRPATRQAAAPTPAPRSAAAPTPAAGAATDTASSAARLPDVPALRRHEALAQPEREALLQRLQQIPRPPRALQQLVSPEFLARASSNELAELVMTEPMVAARVMAAVHAPQYGLRKPVASVGQAIVFLGLNTVRSLALQHLLRDTMATQDRRLQREFDILWQTSATASDLYLLVAQRLQLPDAAGTSTQLVLHFLGRFAAAALDPAASAAPSQRARALAEESRLGLSSGELGALLMHEWRLPPLMMAPTRDIGRIAFVDAPAPEPHHSAALALCALCASLAERMARGQLPEPLPAALQDDPHEDSQRLAAHLDARTLSALREALQQLVQARLQPA